MVDNQNTEQKFSLGPEGAELRFGLQFYFFLMAVSRCDAHALRRDRNKKDDQVEPNN